MKIVIKIRKPVCRTPIKPAQKHKAETQYVRQPKHRLKDANYA
jgi:hypothetical protein